MSESRIHSLELDPSLKMTNPSSRSRWHWYGWNAVRVVRTEMKIVSDILRLFLKPL